MIPAHLRRKRFWTVTDFAEFAGLSHKAAKARLKTYNAAMSGMLLIRSQGENREYTFLPALLARAIDDGRLAQAAGLFDSIDSLEMRVDSMEDRVGDLYQSHRTIASQTGQNTREIAKLHQRLRVA